MAGAAALYLARREAPGPGLRPAPRAASAARVPAGSVTVEAVPAISGEPAPESVVRDFFAAAAEKRFAQARGDLSDSAERDGTADFNRKMRGRRPDTAFPLSTQDWIAGLGGEQEGGIERVEIEGRKSDASGAEILVSVVPRKAGATTARYRIALARDGARWKITSIADSAPAAKEEEARSIVITPPPGKTMSEQTRRTLEKMRERQSLGH